MAGSRHGGPLARAGQADPPRRRPVRRRAAARPRAGLADHAAVGARRRRRHVAAARRVALGVPLLAARPAVPRARSSSGSSSWGRTTASSRWCGRSASTPRPAMHVVGVVGSESAARARRRAMEGRASARSRSSSAVLDGHGRVTAPSSGRPTRWTRTTSTSSLRHGGRRLRRAGPRWDRRPPRVDDRVRQRDAAARRPVRAVAEVACGGQAHVRRRDVGAAARARPARCSPSSRWRSSVTDRGPVLFRQQRVGRDEHEFEVLKFRTMVVDAEARLAELQRRQRPQRARCSRWPSIRASRRIGASCGRPASTSCRS